VLAPAGRMALSNYLLQSLVCAWIFLAYGLRWIGTVGRSPPRPSPSRSSRASWC
jgi:uncharacterized membrane protein YeiB